MKMDDSGDGDGWVNDEVRAAIEGNCRQIDGSGMGNSLVDGEQAVGQLECGANQGVTDLGSTLLY